jgi:hypothetical protein
MSTTAVDKSGEMIICIASLLFAAAAMLAPTALKAAWTSNAINGSSSTIRIDHPERARPLALISISVRHESRSAPIHRIASSEPVSS